jgi:hypothetical protein
MAELGIGPSDLVLGQLCQDCQGQLTATGQQHIVYTHLQ